MKADYIDKMSWELREVVYHSDSLHQSVTLCHEMALFLFWSFRHRWKQSKNLRKERIFISFYDCCCLSQQLRSEQRRGCKFCAAMLTRSFLHLSAPLVAMQFGQLLTHLDTTQQMINNTLKDNNTLLAQVGSPASRREHGWFHSPMRLLWHDNRRLLGGVRSHDLSPPDGKDKVLTNKWNQWSKQRKSDLVTRHPLACLIGGNRLLQLCFFSVIFHFSPHQVQQTMKENLHAIEENFSALDERMKKVSK